MQYRRSIAVLGQRTQVTTQFNGRAYTLLRIAFWLTPKALIVWLLCIPIASAWNSETYPFVENVHLLAVQNVLNFLTLDQLEIIKAQQTYVDQFQDANSSYKHAMTGIIGALPAQSSQGCAMAYPAKQKYIQLAENDVRWNLRAAMQARADGKDNDALSELGSVIHSLEDATSPAHRCFQTWTDNESWKDKLTHLRQENVYPTDGAPNWFKSRLEGAVRYAYDLYMGKAPLPPRFFDPMSGILLLPAQYDHAIPGTP